MQTIHDERVDLRTWVGVLGTMLGAFMATLDIQVTNASLRDITGGIAATQDEGSWVSTSYLIGEIITIPLTEHENAGDAPRTISTDFLTPP